MTCLYTLHICSWGLFPPLHVPRVPKIHKMTIIVLQIPSLARTVWEMPSSLLLASHQSASASSFWSTEPCNIVFKTILFGYMKPRGMSFDLTCFGFDVWRFLDSNSLPGSQAGLWRLKGWAFVCKDSLKRPHLRDRWTPGLYLWGWSLWKCACRVSPWQGGLKELTGTYYCVFVCMCSCAICLTFPVRHWLKAKALTMEQIV